MRKDKLDRLLKKDILTHEEYNTLFNSMRLRDDGNFEGVVPNIPEMTKYRLEGDFVNLPPIEILKTYVTVPLQLCGFDKELFEVYGVYCDGIFPAWIWFTEDNLSATGRKLGCKPLTEATEAEIWKMIAICERYWHIFYEECYRDEKNGSK